jgi:hypothetical protein
MNKFTFVFECGWTPTKITHECEAESLDSVLTEFENFLKGSGYFLDGTLDVVDPDDQLIDFQCDEEKEIINETRE